MLVEMRDAVFGYADRLIVRVESLKLERGRCLGIFGPNGVGKTTLVRGLVGLLAPLRGIAIRSSGVRFGYLPQHRSLDLQWPMTGFDAAALAMSARKRFGWIGSDSRTVREAMSSLNVEDLSHRSFAKLSGGQQLRLLLAGTIATRPDVLVLDEPTDGLDVRSRAELIDILRTQNSRGICTVMISHQVEDLMVLADQVAWLHPGEDSSEPSRVELIDPEQLAQRVTHARRVAVP
jgi:ABC-type Mn2+/Zn2+ transport system ATPase subunit